MLTPTHKLSSSTTRTLNPPMYQPHTIPFPVALSENAFTLIDLDTKLSAISAELQKWMRVDQEDRLLARKERLEEARAATEARRGRLLEAMERKGRRERRGKNEDADGGREEKEKMKEEKALGEGKEIGKGKEEGKAEFEFREEEFPAL